MPTAPGASAVTLRTISEPEEFAALEGRWDALVRAMPRPSPFLLHGRLLSWWKCYGAGARLNVAVAERGGQLVGAAPLAVFPAGGLRTMAFLGRRQAPLADLLLAQGENGAVAQGLVAEAGRARYDLLSVAGLPGDSRLAAVLGRGCACVERGGAPVMDMHDGLGEGFQRTVGTKKRRKRRRQLEAEGRLEVELARRPGELAAALEDAFTVHRARWEGRPDGSAFVTPAGMRFQRAAVQALADQDVARILTLKLDGRPIAFELFYAFCGRMYLHRGTFDPAYARFSTGMICMQEAIQAGAAEGLEEVEFLGGDEPYKLLFADRREPLHEGLGLASTPQGLLAVHTKLGAVAVRSRLKRSERLRRLYFDRLGPAHRLLARRSGRHPASGDDAR